MDHHELTQLTALQPESHFVSALQAESHLVSANHPEPHHVTAEQPEPLHVSDLLPEPIHVSAELPESVTPRDLKSVLRVPCLVSSVRDAPLVSARAAGIPKPIHSSPPVHALVSLSVALPMMGIALLRFGCVHHHWTVWGSDVHCNVSRGGGWCCRTSWGSDTRCCAHRSNGTRCGFSRGVGTCCRISWSGGARFSSWYGGGAQ